MSMIDISRHYHSIWVSVEKKNANVMCDIFAFFRSESRLELIILWVPVVHFIRSPFGECSLPAIIVATNRAIEETSERVNGRVTDQVSEWVRKKRVSDEWICKCLGNEFHVPKNKLVFASISDGFFSAFDKTNPNERAKCEMQIYLKQVHCVCTLP